jgi:multidrug resistance efflux pump
VIGQLRLDEAMTEATDKSEVAANELDAGTDGQSAPSSDPVRIWTIRILALSVVLLIGYLMADRVTPVSTQARVHALVVPIAAEVAGTVTDVEVTNNQPVSSGEVLFRIDAERYQFAVASAAANLQSARQAVGASAAGVDAALAAVASAEAALQSARQDAVRLRRIKRLNSGAISDRRLETAETAVIVAEQQVVAAIANVEQARQNRGSTGIDNSRIVQAQAALEAAQLDLERTSVRAATAGVVTDVRLDRGNFAAAGAPQMTFIATDDVWVQADYTENNLGHVEQGDEVGLAFDVFPGRIFKGTVRSTGFGVAVDAAPLGSLPTIDNNRQWLRDAQRFPVIIDFELQPDDMGKLKVGAQAAAIIYATDSWLLNTLGALYIRIGSILSYAY